MQGQTEALINYRWKNRLLLIYNRATQSEQFNSQMELLGPLDHEFKERKLLVFLITNEGCQALNKEEGVSGRCAISKTPQSNSALFGVELVGLDGDIKLSRNAPITRKELFSRIDAMPMRKHEMNQQPKEKN